MTLSAVAEEGAQFARWSVDQSGTQNPVTITMEADVRVTAVFCDPDAPLLANGDFAGGDEGWTFMVQGAEGSMAITDDGAAHIGITTPGEYDWSVQLFQGGLTLIEGKTYTLSFEARADRDRIVHTGVKHNTSPWTAYLVEPTPLTSHMRQYSYTFVMDQPTDENVRVEFNVGLDDPGVIIDNVVLAFSPAVSTRPSLPRRTANTGTATGGIFSLSGRRLAAPNSGRLQPAGLAVVRNGAHRTRLVLGRR